MMNEWFHNLKRSERYKKVAGVAAGVAYWLGLPVLAVRLIWVIAILLFGTGILLYLILWLIIPEWNPEPSDFAQKIGIESDTSYS